MFNYKINLKKIDLIPTIIFNMEVSKICKKKIFKINNFREKKLKKYYLIILIKLNWNVIKDGGWHLSFLDEQIKLY